MGTPVQVSQKPRQPCNLRVWIEVANCAQEMLGMSYSIKNYSKEGPNGCPPVLTPLKGSRYKHWRAQTRGLVQGYLKT